MLTLPLQAVDPDLARSLQHLQDFLSAKDAIASDDSLSNSEREAAIKALEIDGSSVADLALDFTLPGTEIELKAGGKDETVDIHNLEEYVEAVLDWTLRRGVSTQIDEFKKGFSTGEVPPECLNSERPPTERVNFVQSSPCAICRPLLQSSLSLWPRPWTRTGHSKVSHAFVICLILAGASPDTPRPLFAALTNSTKADHGFTMDSRPVRDFLSIMSEFTPEERREFLSFITGS